MNDVSKVVNFYIQCSKLKRIVRTGWLNWNVQGERVESVAEHIYGVQMLALGMYSEFKCNIDIAKVIFMLAVHELEETVIGDLTRFQISKEEKEKIGHEAVEKILSGLLKGEEIKALIYEFDARETEEAKFAYYCDKLECDIQCKMYDEERLVDINNQYTKHKEVVEEKIRNGEATWSQLWLESDRHIYEDEKFLKVLDYVNENKILGGKS